MSGNSAKVREKSEKGPKSVKGLWVCVVKKMWLWQLNKMLVTKLWCELCMNCDVHGNILRSSHNLTVLHSYFNSFFICDLHGEFRLLNVHLFDILPGILSGKSEKSWGFFSVWRVSTLWSASVSDDLWWFDSQVEERHERWRIPVARHEDNWVVGEANSDPRLQPAVVMKKLNESWYAALLQVAVV